ncbi:unnamed protein product, partial [Didymodactylos carnosus]
DVPITTPLRVRSELSASMDVDVSHLCITSYNDAVGGADAPISSDWLRDENDDDNENKVEENDSSVELEHGEEFDESSENSDSYDDENDDPRVHLEKQKHFKLLQNRFHRSSLAWKTEYFIANNAYGALRNLETKQLKRNISRLHTIKNLKNVFLNLFLGSQIPLQLTRYGAFIHLHHAINLLIAANPTVLNEIGDQTRTLHCRLSQDGTWIGKYLNAFVSTLSWVNAGLKGKV